VFATATRAPAVPYASGVRNTGGNTWEFVLNESADNLTVLRNGGNALNLGALPAGRHTFDMTGFSTFSIEASKSAPVGWTTISDPTNLFTNFTIPSGLAINTIPSSPFFGTVYVGQASTVATERGRAMGDGVYALTADMRGVDLASNFALVTDPNDTSQAKAPGWNVSTSNTASPWRMALDAAGNVIVSDWSDGAGGIKYAAPNLATGGLILATEFGEPGVTVHGSIAGKPVVSGSVGNNLVVHAMDEDLSPFNSIWRWDVGNATNYDQPPTPVIDAIALNFQSSFGGWIYTVNGVRAGNHYSPEHDLWYLVQNRDNGAEAGIFVVDADGVDGQSPMLLWDSLSFSNDPNGDLDPADAIDGNTGEGFDGVQDVFRNIGDVTLSPDGTKLLVQRLASRSTTNPFEGGAVIAIPLDANGVPDINVSGGMMTNVTTIETIGDDLAHSSGAQLEFDAAGNLYVANSGVVAGDPNATAQLVQVLSPGGSTKAITTSAGGFSVVPFVQPTEDADFDNDGDTDGSDFLIWQRGLGPGDNSDGDADGNGQVNGADLGIWRTKFGPTGGATAVPEPGTLALGLAALLLAFGSRSMKR
jgi:hypothetical protein